MGEAEALQARYEQLRRELISIDEQLAVRRRLPERNEDWPAWRRHALRNKAAKTVELVQVKQRLRQLNKDWRP